MISLTGSLSAHTTRRRPRIAVQSGSRRGPRAGGRHVNGETVAGGGIPCTPRQCQRRHQANHDRAIGLSSQLLNIARIIAGLAARTHCSHPLNGVPAASSVEAAPSRLIHRWPPRHWRWTLTAAFHDWRASARPRISHPVTLEASSVENTRLAARGSVAKGRSPPCHSINPNLCDYINSVLTAACSLLYLVVPIYPRGSL